MPGLPGAHNHQNACAAYAAARALGLGPREIEGRWPASPACRTAARSWPRSAGVRFVNDSKATNADSAAQGAAGLSAHPLDRRGLGKDGGIAALAPHLGSVVKAYLIGHSARDFALQLGETPHEICETMARAVARAAAEAEPGEVVLLAPAAASFDQ
jgi:UDP-N-acetylmuramoylalanine--D-glutamate ligase